MPESVGLAWYSTGTVTLTQGSTAVVGVGTNWKNAGLKIGDIFTIDRVTLYMIASVNSNTSITLAQAYAGTSGNSMNYYVIRNFAATLQAELSAQVSQLVGDYESWKDGRVNEIAIPFDFSSLYKGVWATGRSYKALDIVMYNSALYVCLLAHTSASGNTPGTAGAINYWGSYAPAMPPSIDVLNYNNAGAHNSIFRGKNLGTAITAEQLANIRDGSFKDLYIGDYWRLTIGGKTVDVMILMFDPYLSYGANTAVQTVSHHVVVWIRTGFSAELWNYPMNETATCAGHMFNSKMYKDYFPAITEQIEAAIGDGQMKELYDYVGDAINDSNNVSHRTGAVCKLFFLSWQNISGRSDYVSKMAWQVAGSVQFPYFSWALNWLTNWSVGFWLAENGNATQWYEADYQKQAPLLWGGANQSGAHGNVRPFFLLG